MFRTLIVPLDGSAQGERALPYAVRLARAGEGGLVLVRVVLGPLPSGLDWEHQQDEVVAEARSYLANVARRISNQVPVLTSALYGHAADQILDAVQQFHADGIIMTTRARTGMAHFLSGSVAEAVLNRARVPVLLVHARAGEAAAAPFDLAAARILVPLDGSFLSETALSVARTMLGPAGELVLLTVLDPPSYVQEDQAGRVIAYVDQQAQDLLRQGRVYLDALARKITTDNDALRVTCDVRIGAATDEILLAENDHAADLVIMATHGQTGLERALTGSVAGAVVRAGRVPVLLVPPHIFASHPAVSGTVSARG